IASNMGTCWRGTRPIRPSAATMPVFYYLQGCLCQVERKPRAERARGFKTTERPTKFDKHYVTLPFTERHRMPQDALLNHGHTPLGRRRLPDHIHAPDHHVGRNRLSAVSDLERAIQDGSATPVNGLGRLGCSAPTNRADDLSDIGDGRTTVLSNIDRATRQIILGGHAERAHQPAQAGTAPFLTQKS